MADLTKTSQSLIEKGIGVLNPDGKQGKLLMGINVVSMIFAALGNTWAASSDKNTSKEDKKVLVPAGLATGVANIALYMALTERVIKGLENSAQKAIDTMSESDIAKNALEFANKSINKAQKGLFKKPAEYVDSMKTTLIENGVASQKAKDLYTQNIKSGAGVLGSFIGAVVGCAILTPIIRDVTAFGVQKIMEKKNKDLKNEPYKPYFDPTHLKVNVGGKNQALTMKNYMAFTNRSSMKV